MNKETKEKLKAYFSSKFLGYNGDAYASTGCDTCGPECIGFSMEKIGEIIDSFDEAQFQDGGK